MANEARYENERFEQEVRRIARALWPSSEFSGAVMVDGRETDGIFETEDCIHIVEATTSRKKEKASQDIVKLVKLIQKHRRVDSARVVRGWFITRDEPTADQREVTNKHRRNNVNTLSFLQFQARLIDSQAYINARDSYKFGSVRDPATGEHSLDIKYVPLDLLDVNSNNIFSHKDFDSMISEGRTIVLLGDYGAGKSMTLREIYYNLRKEHLKGNTGKFPVYLNLRDHYGQRDAAEVITRHSRSIGFDHPSHLVRAWRAGYVHLLIDGFDEISTISIQGQWHNLGLNRYRAMEAVRCLIREHPKGAGLLVAGRAHFFDNPSERRRALALPQDAIELSLTEFTEVQIRTYLERVGLSGSVPPWLPSRPLLVGYLAAKGFLSNFFDEEATDQPTGPAAGWDALLDNVAAREAEIEAGIDGNTVRRILERLATKVRSLPDGLGSISRDTVIQAFREICGNNPDDRGLVLLQRLPGLGVDREEENSRTFIDEAFADACKSGDIVDFVDKPFDFPSSVLEDIESSVGVLGIEVASRKIELRGFGEGKLNTALSKAYESGTKYMAWDIVRLISEIGHNIRQEVRLERILIPSFELKNFDTDLSKLRFVDCFFRRVEIDQNADVSRMPSFYECYIDEVEGRVSKSDLPMGKFDDKCEFDRFNTTAETTSEMLALDLPLGIRVCLTVLKKLYMQIGAGRRENALYGGLDDRARRLVPRVLQVLQSEGFTLSDRSKNNTIWRPCRSHNERVRKIIIAPSESDDPVLRRCASLSN